MATTNKYLNSCILPRNSELLKTMYFDNKKPMGKVTQNDIHSAAMCGLKTINPKSKTCLCKI